VERVLFQRQRNAQLMRREAHLVAIAGHLHLVEYMHRDLLLCVYSMRDSAMQSARGCRAVPKRHTTSTLPGNKALAEPWEPINRCYH
jgi:hypothetical protein